MKLIRTLLLSLVVLSSGIARAQVQTTDPIAIAQALQQSLQQLQQLKAAVQQAEQQYAAITGSIGNFSNLLPNSLATLRANLPQNWSQVYADAMNSNSSITGTAQSMLSQFDSQIRGMGRTDALSFISQKLREKGADDRVMAQNAYDNQMQELTDMQALTAQIAQAPSQKAISDLQARIATAQGQIQGEHAKLQLMAMGQQSQQQLLQSQQALAQKRFLYGDDGEANTAPNLSGN